MTGKKDGDNRRRGRRPEERACPTGEEAGGDRASGGPRRPGSRGGGGPWRPGSRGGGGPWRPAEERPEKRAAEDGTERAPEEQTTASGGAEIRQPDGRDVDSERSGP